MGLLYGFVAVGLLDARHPYRATNKDAASTTPRWPAIALWLVALALLLAFGRWAARRLGADVEPPSPRLVKGLGLLVVTATAAVIAATMPLALLFLLPLVARLAIGGRRGGGRAPDVVTPLVGGAVEYGLFCLMDWQALKIDAHLSWYLMMKLSIGTVSVGAAAVILATAAAGVGIVVWAVRSAAQRPAVP